MYPIITDQSEQEDKSDLIFRSQIKDVFDKWIINKVPKDVGIDYEIQIVIDGQVTGKIFYVQLKSKEKIEWNKKLNCSIPIKSTTVKYWMNTEAPVYIFLVDVEKKEIFYCNVKSYIRGNFSQFIDIYKSDTPTKTKNFKINRGFAFYPNHPKTVERFSYNLYKEKIHIPTLDKLNHLHTKMSDIQKDLFLLGDEIDKEFEQELNAFLNIEADEDLDDSHSIASVITYCEQLLSVSYDFEYDNEYSKLRQNVDSAKNALYKGENLSQYVMENFQNDIIEMQNYLFNHYAFLYGQRELLYWRYREIMLKESKYSSLLDEFVVLESARY